MARETKVRCEQCNKLADESVPGAAGPKGLPKGWVEVTLALNGQAPGSVHAEVCSEGCAKNLANKAIVDFFHPLKEDAVAEVGTSQFLKPPSGDPLAPGWVDSTDLPRNR